MYGKKTAKYGDGRRRKNFCVMLGDEGVGTGLLHVGGHSSGRAGKSGVMGR